jgi:hypothetical protein
MAAPTTARVAAPAMAAAATAMAEEAGARADPMRAGRRPQ